MKKILSLAIALLLVFAIAAPAMAITGYVDPATSSLPNPPWAGNLKLTAGNPNMINLLSMQDISANKAYIYNETLYYVVSLYTPTSTTCSYALADYAPVAAGAFDPTTANAYVRLSSDVAALQVNTVAMYLVLSGGSAIRTITEGVATAADQFDASLDSYKNELTITLPTNITGVINGAYPDTTNPGGIAKTTYIVGTAVVSANVNGTLKAVIRSGNLNKWERINATGLITATPSVINSGKNPKYTISLSASPKWSRTEAGATTMVDVQINSGSYTNFVVSFERTGGNFVCKDGIYVTNLTPITYRVLMPTWVGSGVSVLSFQEISIVDGTPTATPPLASTDAAAANLLGAYNEVMNFFGFVYSAEGKLYDVHFLQKLQSFGAEAEVPVTLYGTAITIPDAGTEIPQTGDAASTLGFVMIALAIVAAAAVAYKKVRA